MKIRRKLTAAVFSAVLATAAVAGCSTGEDATNTSGGTTAAAAAVSGDLSAAAVLGANKDDHAEDADTTYDESQVVEVKLSNDSATASGDGVNVDGATVTITAGGTYRLSGSLKGQVVIKAADATVKLILNGVDIASSTTAAIAATEADKVVVILADGSRNTLSDANSYADDADVNAALYSAADLTIAGGGALTVKGNGNDAIASQDGIVIASGTIAVEAADDGIRGKDYLVVNGGTITATTGGDGLKADNAEEADAGYIAVAGGTLTVTAKGDGADAATDVVVTGGTLTVTAGGGRGVSPTDETSTKALKSGVAAVLEGGTVKLDSSDDAINSDAAVRLGGATVTATSGDDAVHAEAKLVVDAGSLNVTKSNEGLESAEIVLSGGDVSLTSSDDGINAASGTGGGPGGGGESVGDYSVTVSGGTLVIHADGDGFDSNGTATITGGTVVVNGPTSNGNGALDVNGTFQISGGLLLAAGSAGMAVAPDTDSAQGWLSATFTSAVASGTTIQVVDSDGKVVATFVTSSEVQNLVYSSSAITKGEKYQIYGGGTAAGDSTGGLAASGSLGSATSIATVTAGEAPAGGMGPGGGRRR